MIVTVVTEGLTSLTVSSPKAAPIPAGPNRFSRETRGQAAAIAKGYSETLNRTGTAQHSTAQHSTAVLAAAEDRHWRYRLRLLTHRVS
jgi:hypothetical protein